MSIDDLYPAPSFYDEPVPSAQHGFAEAVGPQVLGTSETGFRLLNTGRDSNLIVVKPGESIQQALDTLRVNGGGTIALTAGTYTVKTALTGYSSIAIVGISPLATIIDFASTAANLSYAGTSVYSTGTITSITSGVNVTGSGTSWLANASAGQHIFLGTRWYRIAAVTGDTTLVLAEGYGDDVTMPGAAYHIATVIVDVIIRNVTLKSSTGTALTITDARQCQLDNVQLTLNNKGVVLTNCSEINADRILTAGSTSNGVELTNVGLCDFESVNAISNGGHGFVLSNVKTISFYACAANANTTDGLNVTTGVDLVFLLEATGNGGQGFEAVATCSNITIQGPVRSNTSDGIKLTATSDDFKIHLCQIVGNGAYGINIAASTCDNALITNSTFASNATAAANDSGTGTVIRGNVGLSDNAASNGFFSYTASDTLQESADTEQTHSNATPTLKKEILAAVTGVMRVKFDLRRQNITGFAHGRVYVNDVAVGTDQISTSSTYATVSEDFNVQAGDSIQLYIWIDTGLGDLVYVRNFRIYFTKTFATDELTVVTN